VVVHTMKFQRRRLLQLCAGIIALPAVSRDASAQTYPTRPVTVIAPFAAGGTTDVIARVVAERMTKSLGQPVVIENVTGAGGSIAVGRTARARPDGYTIDFGTIGTHVFNGALYSLSYDLLNDFAPISPLGTTAFILCGRNTLPAKDLGELVAWLKANPNKASAGFGSPGLHLLAAFFENATGTQLTLVPYRGGPPQLQDLIAGQIDLSFYPTDALSLIKAGSIKAYGVTSDARLALAPDIPTFAEMGLPMLSYSSGWEGLFAPKGTPKDIIVKLNSAVVEAPDPTVQSRLLELGQEIFPRERQTPEALAAMQKADAQKWWPFIKEFGIKAE
jgi:tripartite-type tricarboxylate transporter receptor subunit TctC